MYALENDKARATYALDHFLRPLYDIEAECKMVDLDFDGITEKRQAEALPILQAFRRWLLDTLPLLIPKTPIYKAVNYALNNYNGITQYVNDGILCIDNNQLEGQIRAIALGRNAHLFAGSHRGGELAAIIYSFMATCRLHSIDPAKWLHDVLHRMPVQPEDKLIELLPQFWQPLANQKEKTA